MEEREALKRQIELLQNLINQHKSVHGDTPFARVEQSHPEVSTSTRSRGRGRTHNTSVRGTQYAPAVPGSWRKTYSLSNKKPSLITGHSLASASSCLNQSSPQGLSQTNCLSDHREIEERTGTRTDTLVPHITQQKQEEQTSSIPGVREDASKLTATKAVCKKGKGTSLPQHEGGKGNLTAVEKHLNTVVSDVPSTAKANTSTSLQCSSQIQGKPYQSISKQSPSELLSQSGHVQGSSNSQKSKFTWVKTQTLRGSEPKQSSSLPSTTTKMATLPSISLLKPEVTVNTPPSSISKRNSAKKLPRKSGPVTVVSKTSKYRWVSSSAVTQTKASHKTLSPKAQIPAQRALGKTEAALKVRPSSSPSAKIKKGNAPSFRSRYHWKAGGQSTSVPVTGGSAVVRRRSAFHWTSEKSNREFKGGSVPSPLRPQGTSPPPSSPCGFKLCSRMKIIRRSGSSVRATEKGGSPKYSPRSRIHNWTRSPFGVKRTSSRLVSFGRHKLRRLTPTLSRTSPTSAPHRSPASQRVFRTRYKMVNRPSCNTASPLPYNPALSWRVKKIQSARSFLQNRSRAPHSRHPSSIQDWRGSSMCWIRGSLYRVSANKLSRTVASNMSINRTGKFSNPQVSSMPPGWNRYSTSRHLASRAVQRSIAIIRHARHKKQQKQYCMYYNRFGKCNRGSSCPYVHDPDKVAVCTRFLRGTCKQAEGSCPFSHKVAKEKMPVCSYFLKGICNNNNCPYSHVYVSRKAEVCEDFVKGYCPEGEKCKKKHTLVCPDFSKTGSCPRGQRCKLQHRQRAKRATISTSTPPAKKARSKEPSKRPSLSVIMPQDCPAARETPAAGSLALPSFISLSSSPEEADAPDTLPAHNPQVKEKKLQIKPRL